MQAIWEDVENQETQEIESNSSDQEWKLNRIPFINWDSPLKQLNKNQINYVDQLIFAQALITNLKK